MLADTHRLFIICGHKAEHHLNNQQHRVKVPNNRRLVKQLDSVCGSNAAKGFYCLTHQIFWCRRSWLVQEPSLLGRFGYST